MGRVEGGRSGRGHPERLPVFQPEFREDLTYWVEADPRVALKVLRLVEDVLRDPFQGLGKPEPLRHALKGCWSRRITGEHRLVYRPTEGFVGFLQCRYHY